MKKKLEAELISLAHRILQLKNKEDIAVLQEEARKLYEKLSVLRFVEENLSEAKPTIGQAEVEQKIESAFADGAKQEKVIVGEIPSEEELESAERVSELVGNLASAKSVTDEPISEHDKAEISAEQQPDGHEEKETPEETEQAFEVEEPKKEDELSPETQEKSEETQQETVESPTLEQASEFVPAEASEEIKFAEEANKATEMFWEAKPDELPAAETNTEAPAGSNQDDIFEPKFELRFDDKSEEKAENNLEDAPAPTFTFDDLLGKDYADPVFVKPEELQSSFDAPKAEETQTPKSDENKPEEAKEVIPISRSLDKTNVIPLNKDERGVTLNDKLSKGITIGLNDRIAFMKHLFNNSSEDYNRVLSQLITFDNYIDAKDFIDTMVKPDYENWGGKEEYEQRFLEIIEKRFQ